MTEFAWVIELGSSPVSEPEYYAPQLPKSWTKDHNLACRFARKQDAEVIADAYGISDEPIRICEHGWG